MTSNSGVLYVVATPIGNLSDISERAKTILETVDIIAAEDTPHTSKLLNHYGISSKLLALHAHNERQKSSSIIQKLQRGESIALVSDAGTPLISDPGYKLVANAHANSIRIVGF